MGRRLCVPSQSLRRTSCPPSHPPTINLHLSTTTVTPLSQPPASVASCHTRSRPRGRTHSDDHHHAPKPPSQPSIVSTHQTPGHASPHVLMRDVYYTTSNTSLTPLLATCHSLLTPVPILLPTPTFSHTSLPIILSFNHHPHTSPSTPITVHISQACYTYRILYNASCGFTIIYIHNLYVSRFQALHSPSPRGIPPIFALLSHPHSPALPPPLLIPSIIPLYYLDTTGGHCDTASTGLVPPPPPPPPPPHRVDVSLRTGGSRWWVGPKLAIHTT